mmetsp:Transcript_15836/g.33104  ORF Transcript_15836/g.33104 Transcript_15836/m.33104 type:complete len:275 (-) Transcript_15836:22-846(-)
MLSVLQRQAKLLESEKKKLEVSRLELKQANRELEFTVKAKDEEIAYLKGLLGQQGGGGGDNAATNIGTDAATEDELISSEQMLELIRLINELKLKLETAEGRLTFSELRTSFLELDKLTLKSNFEQQINALKSRLAAQAKEASALKDGARGAEMGKLKVQQLAADIERRDEQIQFLLDVHNAAASGSMDTSTEGMIPISTLNWARDGGSASTPRAHQQLGAALSYAHSQDKDESSPNQGVGSLVAMGFDRQEATVALAAANGDADAAALQLLPP